MLRKNRVFCGLLSCVWGVGFGVGCLAATKTSSGPLILEAEEALLTPSRVEVVAQESFRGKKGVSLKDGVASVVDAAVGDGKAAADEADLVFRVQVPQAGRYSFTTYAATDAQGTELMRKARTKFESLFLRLQVPGQEPTRRVVFVPWGEPASNRQHTGNFMLEGGAQEVRVWLPAGVRLDRLEVRPFAAPAVPEQAVSYRPPFAPPARHPRLWVDPASLARARASLAHPDHKPVWERLRAAAAKPFSFAPPPRGELPYNTPLEQAALNKAFCHLMQEDAKLGREAVDLMLSYLPRVSFGNILDITREMGAAIHAAACVYDWCHGLMSDAERATLRTHLLRLADDMECGWPPFRTSVVNGHGNEAMINRDLLSMAIAIHDEDPVPYRYCAYRLLEELVPMRRFEYQSPRHNQGVSYGAYRFGWEMQAAWLLRFIAGREAFDANIKNVSRYWLYMRLPNGEMLRDGDGSVGGKYWRHPGTMLLCYSYAGDPIMKGEFLRQGGGKEQPMLYLLLDDPALKAESSLASLPLTIDFGPVLGGMIARTGWNMGPASTDVVAEIKGGGHHFGNHQHAEAGALQIFYRGLLAGKLSQYGFYGTPYDYNFSKRSVAQSMMLVFDPKEQFLKGTVNDGGSRFLQAHPKTPQEAQRAPYRYGTVESCSFGPDAAKPAFSYFAADLRGAYSDKVSAYVRRFCFLNLGRPGNPAAMIVLDDLTTKDPSFRKVWQLNTLQPPQTTSEGVRLTSGGAEVGTRLGAAGKGGEAAEMGSAAPVGRLDVRLLAPAAPERALAILSGREAHTVAGKAYTPPNAMGPEANGHRIQFSATTPRAHDRFLAVLQACDDEPLPVAHEIDGDVAVVRIADRVVALAQGTTPTRRAFQLNVPPRTDGAELQVLLAGLAPGTWHIDSSDAPRLEVPVQAGRNTAHFRTPGGAFRIIPKDAP